MEYRNNTCSSVIGVLIWRKYVADNVTLVTLRFHALYVKTILRKPTHRVRRSRSVSPTKHAQPVPHKPIVQLLNRVQHIPSRPNALCVLLRLNVLLVNHARRVLFRLNVLPVNHVLHVQQQQSVLPVNHAQHARNRLHVQRVSHNLNVQLVNNVTPAQPYQNVQLSLKRYLRFATQRLIVLCVIRHPIVQYRHRRPAVTLQQIARHVLRYHPNARNRISRFSVTA